MRSFEEEQITGLPAEDSQIESPQISSVNSLRTSVATAVLISSLALGGCMKKQYYACEPCSSKRILKKVHATERADFMESLDKNEEQISLLYLDGAKSAFKDTVRMLKLTPNDKSLIESLFNLRKRLKEFIEDQKKAKRFNKKYPEILKRARILLQKYNAFLKRYEK